VVKTSPSARSCFHVCPRTQSYTLVAGRKGSGTHSAVPAPCAADAGQGRQGCRQRSRVDAALGPARPDPRRRQSLRARQADARAAVARRLPKHVLAVGA
jgi:hypothetical protein